MRYIIFKSGASQYKAHEGDVVEVEKLQGQKGREHIFDKVLLYVTDAKTYVGNPYVEAVTVKGTIVDQKKADKVLISKFKAKVRYRRSVGHRKHLTEVRIDKIVSEKSP